MRFGLILQSVYDQLGYSPNTPDNATVRRIKQHANDVYREIMGKKGFGPLRQATLTFQSVANIPDAVLPQVASRVIAIVDRTNMSPLDPRSLQDIRLDDPGASLTSTFPYEYVVLNLSAATFRDPSTADSVFVKSTAAGDTTQTAFVDVILSNGMPRSLSVALNGTTAVNLSASVSNIVAVKKFYVSAVTAGDVVLTQTSGVGTELARIPVGRTFSRYSRILLHPTPTTVNTYYADVELAIDDLSNDYDEPILPEDFHWLIETGVLMREYNSPKRQLPVLYSAEKARFTMGVSDLTSRVWSMNGAGTASATKNRRFSQLGPNFAAGT